MRLTLTEPRYLRDSIMIISELVNEANLRISKDKIELIAMDPASVAMVVFKLLSSAFSEYDVKEEKVIGISLINLTQILKRAKPTDILTLELDENVNRMRVTLKGTTTKKFELSLLDISEKEQKMPNLKFSARVEANTILFGDAIEDMDVIGDSLSLSASKDSFIIECEGTISKGNVEITGDEETTLQVLENPVSARYSIEYLKKIIKGGKLTNTVILEFGQDYPLKAEYKIIDKLNLQFVLAPRAPTE